MKKLLIMMLVVSLLVLGCDTKDNTESSSEPNIESTEATGEALPTYVEDPTVIAKVGDQEITQSMFDKNMALIQFNFNYNNGENAFENLLAEKGDEVRAQLLQDLVDEAAAVLIAKDKKIKIDDEQIEDQYNLYISEMFGSFENPSPEGKPIADHFKANGIDAKFIKASMKSSGYRQMLIDSLMEDVKQDEKLLETIKKNPIEVEASHILVKDAALADEIYEKLKKDPGQWNALAKEYSIDGTNSKGGELGFFTRYGMMVEPFAKAAFETPKGEISKPVMSEFGYHIIKVTEVKGYDDYGQDVEMNRASAIDLIYQNEAHKIYQELIEAKLKEVDVMTTEVRK